MQSDSPLLILADLPPSFRLTDLKLSEEASQIISLSRFRHQDLDGWAAIIAGMTFTILLQSADEVAQTIAITDCDHIFCKSPDTVLSGVAIALGEHIGSAKHDETVNRALLQLARHVGQSVDASSVIWRPAGLNIGFEYFAGATDHYAAGGPFPVLAQIAISKTRDHIFQTSGLSYFSDQEIRLSAPADLASNEVVRRLVRLAHDIAIDGKIEQPVETDGLVAGERLSFTPSDDGQIVDIAIVAEDPRQLQ
ncbi:hypothetical protein [Sphingorhabdus sp. Alg231-15]|uniref:hypothetical protein n=1 Tax=Sphingorhabdus sp. Alg231-15 TaxID=1922222 RepID=UPI000D54D879